MIAKTNSDEIETKWECIYFFNLRFLVLVLHNDKHSLGGARITTEYFLMRISTFND